MKTSLLLISILSAYCLYAQNSIKQEYIKKEKNDTINCLTAGILNGGGGLIGFDIAFILWKKLGIQGGISFLPYSYGGGINYYLKPTIKSSSLAILFMHQGYDNTFFQSAIGPSFIYRSKRWFTARLGFGSILKKGPVLEKYLKEKGKTPADYPSVILTYSIGILIY